jgi:hypothetical protein
MIEEQWCDAPLGHHKEITGHSHGPLKSHAGSE